MKKLRFILLLIAFVTLACDKDIERPDETEVRNHLIEEYWLYKKYDVTCFSSSVKFLSIGPVDNTKPDSIYAYDSSDSVCREKFHALAEKHNDLYFADVERTATKAVAPYETAISAIDFNSVTVVSDADWDENHPAGTCLNDLFELYARNYYHFINSDYVFLPEYYSHNDFISKPLTELVSGDLWCLVRGGFELIFSDNMPSSEMVHNFTITLTTDSAPIVLTVTVDFSDIENI